MNSTKKLKFIYSEASTCSAIHAIVILFRFKFVKSIFFCDINALIGLLVAYKPLVDLRSLPKTLNLIPFEKGKINIEMTEFRKRKIDV